MRPAKARVAGKYSVRVRAYIGRIPWRTRTDGCCVLAVFEYVATFGVDVGAGALTSDASSTLIAATNGWFTLVVTDNKASLIDLKPRPSQGSTRVHSRPTQLATLPAKVARANAYAWVMCGFGA